MSTTATMVAGILATLCCSSAMAAEPDVNHPALAKFILESLPAKTGLCVHLGVQDGGLAVALSDGGRFLVHGLGTEQDGIERARKRIVASRPSLTRGHWGRYPCFSLAWGGHGEFRGRAT